MLPTLRSAIRISSCWQHGDGVTSAADVQLLNVSYDPMRELTLIAGDQVFISPRRFDLFPSQLH